MTFLMLVLVVGAYTLLGWHFKPAHDQWFFRFIDVIAESFDSSPRTAMLISLLAPLVLVALIFSITEHWFFGFVGFALQVLILFYALGRTHLSQEVEHYLRHWRAGDLESAERHAGASFYFGQRLDVNSQGSLHRWACRGFLYQWFEQIFVMIFWPLVRRASA